MASTEFVDPYLDPETGLLRNKVGAQTKVALDEAEGDLSFARLVQLMDHPVKPTGDLDELRAIHRHLFQDVYDWAGELRTVDIRKNVEGAQFFLPVSMIGRAAGYAEGELRADHELRGMSREQFIDRLAYHYDQFNYVHPRGQRPDATSVLEPRRPRRRLAARLARGARRDQRPSEPSGIRAAGLRAAARDVRSDRQQGDPAG